jgi:cell division septation protein DedD
LKLSQDMKLLSFTLFALIVSVFADTITINSNEDLKADSNQYGIRCTISGDYQLSVTTFPNFVTSSFDLSSFSADQVNSASVRVNPTSCAGGSLLSIQVSSYASDYSFDASDIVDKSTPSPDPPFGYSCDIPTLTTTISSISITDSCQGTNSVDVTSAVKSALNAGNPSLVLKFLPQITQTGSSICFSTSGNLTGIECNIGINGASSGSSYALTVVTNDSPTTSSSSAPTSTSTSVPTTPSTAVPGTSTTVTPTAAPGTPTTRAPSAPTTLAPTSAPGTPTTRVPTSAPGVPTTTSIVNQRSNSNSLGASVSGIAALVLTVALM